MVSEWQPIETGKEPLLVVDLWSVKGFRYPDAAWDVIGDSASWTDANHHGSIEEYGPFTHWMPLPAPPETTP